MSMGLRDFEIGWRDGDTVIDFSLVKIRPAWSMGKSLLVLTELRRPCYDFINIPGVAGLGFWALGITELDETALTLRRLWISYWRILLMVYDQIEL